MVGAAGGLDLRPGFCLASFQQGLQAFYKDTGRKARWRQLKAGEKGGTQRENVEARRRLKV